MIAKNTDLTKQLLKPGIDREIICEILYNHYQTSHGNTVELNFGAQNSPSIILKWTPKGAVKSIIAAKDLDDEDFARLETALLEALKPSGPQYRRFPILSHFPVSGAIGFTDWFQIFPAPETAPQPSNYRGGFVSVLEVCVEGSSLPMLVAQRAYRQAREIELLLSALTGAGFRMHHNGQESVWVLDPNDEWKPKHLLRGYSHPEVEGVILNFSDISTFERIELVDVNGYFTGQSQGSNEDTFLPDSFPLLAKKFNVLKKEDRLQFLRAARWILQMDEVWRISRSAAYIAAVSAIETLLPPQPSGEQPCPECGNRQTRGVTQRFADFVESMVGGSIPRKQLLEFYRRRSKLVHGLSISKNDDHDLIGADPMRLREDADQRWLKAIARSILHGWLVAIEVPAKSQAPHQVRGDDCFC